jgi:hypothetical protein
MVDHLANLLALRALAAGLVVASTGETEIEATPTGFARAAGSFLADGFAVGMEVEPVGFASAVPAIVTGLSDLEMHTLGGQAPEAAAPSRALSVGLPSGRAWENARFTPQEGRWFAEEDYLPGPAREPVRGIVEGEPMYVLKLYSPPEYGVAALYTVSGALLDLYRPGMQIPLSTGDVLHVRTNPAPYRGQLTQRNGRALVVVTIPTRTMTANILP